jgi:hypothetical protein
MFKRIAKLFGNGKAEPQPPSAPVIIREDRDVLRPGSIVRRGHRAFRITKLLMVNKLGAFYEAHEG